MLKGELIQIVHALNALGADIAPSKEDFALVEKIRRELVRNAIPTKIPAALQITSREAPAAKGKARKKKRAAAPWTEERRAAHIKRVKAYWKKRKAAK